MNCETCRERLVDWLEEGSDPAVRDHLAACRDCRALFDSAESAAQTLETATAPKPRSTWKDLAARLRPEPVKRRRWPYGIAAAAAAVVLAIQLFAGGASSEPPRRLKIEVVDAEKRVESSEMDAVLDSMEVARSN